MGWNGRNTLHLHIHLHPSIHPSNLLQPSPEPVPHLQRKAFHPPRRLGNALVDLVRIRALADGGRGAGLAAGLAADNGGHGGSPLGSVGALGFGGLWALA